MRVVLTKAVVIKVGRAASSVAAGCKRHSRGPAAAALAFACGAGLSYAFSRAARPKRVVESKPSVAATASPTPCAAAPAAHGDDYDDLLHTPELDAWESTHNGSVLPLRYDDETLRWGLAEGKVVVTASGRTLATAGDTLYMLDAGRRRVLWKYTTNQVLFDFAYVEATGLVYATAGDNTMFILDGSTGRELYHDSRNGSAGYGVVIPYGEDSCLVTDSFGVYNSAYRGGYEPTQDGVTAWRGTRMLWHRDVPPDAELQVVGRKVYAVTKTKTRILVKEIKVPKGAR